MLLQVYLHAAIAAQAGEFDIEDVARGLRDKMLRRNPHVFGDVEETDPARINETWEAVKAAEKQRSRTARRDPARAARPQPRRQGAGPAGTRRQPAGSAPTPTSTSDLGDRLLALVAEAGSTGVDPEQALRDAVRRVSA